MPGKNDPSLPGASFLSDWELYRTGLTAADNISDDAHVAAIVELIDLSRNANGLTNQIWVNVNRTAGNGNIDLTLYREENGAWASVIGQVQCGTQSGVATKAQKIFTGLMAGKYRVAVTNVTGGATWDVYIAHT